MEYPVLINNKLFTIKDEADIIGCLQSDDEFLIQYVINLIKKGKGPAISPHDINGFLNIERVQYPNGASNFGNCTKEAGNVQPHDDTTANSENSYFQDMYDLPDNYDMTEDMTDMPENETIDSTIYNRSNNTGNENIPAAKEVWCTKGKSETDDSAATEIMMHLRSSEKYVKKFDDKKSVKLTLWKEIAKEMEKSGYLVSGEKCRQKYLNLTKKYIFFVRHSKQTGNNKINPPPFYELLHKILGHKDKVVLGEIQDSITLPELPNDSSARNLEESQEATGSSSNSISEEISFKDNKKGELKIPKKNITKADIINQIKEGNDKAINAQKESMDKVMGVLSEQNTLIKDGMKQNREQRSRLIDLFEKMVKNKKKRRRSPSSDSE